jgi:site-specific recombinase XerD
MSAKSFGTLFERLGRRAGMPFTIFPHMLRHACGYALANAGHDTRALQAWLGHKNIQHTVRYRTFACPLPRLLEGEWPLNESVLPLRDSRTSETASGGVR